MDRFANQAEGNQLFHKEFANQKAGGGCRYQSGKLVYLEGQSGTVGTVGFFVDNLLKTRGGGEGDKQKLSSGMKMKLPRGMRKRES